MRSRSRSRPSWRSALARATREERLVALVAQAATKNWRAAAWILERRYPERWGPERLRARDVLNGVAYGKRKLPGWRLSDDRVQDVLGGTRWARVFLGPEPKRRGSRSRKLSMSCRTALMWCAALSSLRRTPVRSGLVICRLLAECSAGEARHHLRTRRLAPRLARITRSLQHFPLSLLSEATAIFCFGRRRMRPCSAGSGF
jgi:hypothetical protein